MKLFINNFPPKFILKRVKEAVLLALRPSLILDTVIVAIVLLIELLGVYVAGAIKHEGDIAPQPLIDPVKEWVNAK